MKKLLLICLIPFLFTMNLYADYFSFQPYTIIQPDGDIIDCFVSGDEYFNWLHDQEGYTIIQADDGYFYYGELSGNKVVPTIYKVNSVNPASVGINKWTKIPVSEYEKTKALYDEPLNEILEAPYTGAFNNLVVYIRFSDDTEFSTTRQEFDNNFNLTPGTSLKSYYSEVSYNMFTVSSTHYPACSLTTNLSYQDSHPRSYYQPYNATTNTNGYEGGDNGSQRTQREHTLLKNAIEWININSPVPGTLNIDGDNDGYIDNVCFNIKGSNGAWACLLWAHSWSLYSINVKINNKRVYNYTFQPETQINVKTLCHEMFHAVGAPDLYHYSMDGKTPVSNWDLMESGFGHMGAYMKWKYTNNAWISSLPEITTSGTYTLNPLASPTNNCYKIASPNSISQFYIVEYRRKVSGTFENNVPGSGLLVYRIDPTRWGNASGPPDEVYIYRPNGTTTVNGSPSLAYFSSESGRTVINNTTNPSGFLQNGTPGGLDISNITSAGATISFTVSINIVEKPSNLIATALSYSQIDLGWQKNSNGDNTMLLYNTSPTFGDPVQGTSYNAGNSLAGGGTVIYKGSNNSFNHTGLEPFTTYFYKLFSVNTDTVYSLGVEQNATTPCDVISAFPWNEGFEEVEILPSCWEEERDVIQYGWRIRMGNGDVNPSTAHTGIYNACYKDYTSTSNLASLFTPTFNLSTLLNPTLSFWHTQAPMSTNQDILSIYYKNSVEGTWTLLDVYTSNITSWTKETISLPNASSIYSIKFEGNAKNGHGVCIDDVEISGLAVPPNYYLTDVTVGDSETECYDATDTIFVAGTDTVEFLSGSSVELIAGTSIFFLPGFYAAEGSNVHAYITTEALFCDSYPAGNLVSLYKNKSTTETEAKVNENMQGKREQSIKVYPNPNNGQFTLELKNFGGTSTISIINILGTIVYKSTLIDITKSDIDLSYLQKGIYFVKVKNGDVVKTNKMIIQ